MGAVLGRCDSSVRLLPMIHYFFWDLSIDRYRIDEDGDDRREQFRLRYRINERRKRAVFLLWGAPAQKKRSLVSGSRHYVLAVRRYSAGRHR
jgi:hypothetical protein